jgi:hypothetical protein
MRKQGRVVWRSMTRRSAPKHRYAIGCVVARRLRHAGDTIRTLNGAQPRLLNALRLRTVATERIKLVQEVPFAGSRAKSSPAAVPCCPCAQAGNASDRPSSPLRPQASPAHRLLAKAPPRALMHPSYQVRGLGFQFPGSFSNTHIGHPYSLLRVALRGWSGAGWGF